MTSDLSDYLAYLTVERQASPRSIAAYGDDLARYQAHLASTRGVADPRVATVADVRSFVAAQGAAGRAGSSVRRRLSAIRSWYRWLLREGRVTANPASGVRAPKSPRRLPNVLDADEVGGLLELPEGDPLALRDRAILELFYSSALRLSELVSLRWRDLDLVDASVRVLGKGGKTRIAPVGRLAVAALQAWRDASSAATSPPEAFVFPGRGGAALSPRAVQQRLKHWAQAQGLWKRVHPHLLRHSCASHVLESSGNLRAVQELLGHADIATTQIYTHLDFQHLAKVYDAAHPRARRKRA
jgi:integrase/recombinase XerC